MLILILRRIFERKAVPPNGIRRKAVIQIEPNQHIKLQRGEFEVFNNRLINHLIEKSNLTNELRLKNVC